MNPILIGVLLLTIPLIFVLFRFFSLIKNNEEKLAEKQRNVAAYKRALDEAKNAELKEKIYKAKTGHTATQIYLAKESELGDTKKAIYWYEMAAKNDNEIAMHSLVRLCDNYENDAEINKKSKYWSKVINAKNGGQEAKLALGIALLKGDGVDADIEKGIEMIESVADINMIDAQLFMADWYVAEANPKPSVPLSVEWNTRAALNGSVEAQINLGKQYSEGKGITIDFKKATYWFELAAESGNAIAQYYAGEVSSGNSEKGNSVAYIWFWLACKNGVENAIHRRDEMGNLLSVDTVVGLQGMVKSLFNKMKRGTMTKHSVIKTFDKLYSRQSYFPDETTEIEEAESSDVDEAGDTPQRSTNYSQTSMDDTSTKKQV
ncbi:MAG: sel1 repeat family protein [Aliivibrio sp.]|uniref:tetratricopeptide repeat protein n=1 Tax=Aliivibrio sp. TaxID=1872443 RepID=UPI001A50CBBB|nr:sel1 repeat family protein [Aliivibrio sp.]